MITCQQLVFIEVTIEGIGVILFTLFQQDLRKFRFVGIHGNVLAWIPSAWALRTSFIASRTRQSLLRQNVLQRV